MAGGSEGSGASSRDLIAGRREPFDRRCREAAGSRGAPTRGPSPGHARPRDARTRRLSPGPARGAALPPPPAPPDPGTGRSPSALTCPRRRGAGGRGGAMLRRRGYPLRGRGRACPGRQHCGKPGPEFGAVRARNRVGRGRAGRLAGAGEVGWGWGSFRFCFYLGACKDEVTSPTLGTARPGPASERQGIKRGVRRWERCKEALGAV